MMKARAAELYIRQYNEKSSKGDQHILSVAIAVHKELKLLSL